MPPDAGRDGPATTRPFVLHVAVAAEFVTHIMIHDLRRLRGRCDQLIVCAPGNGLDEIRAEGFQVITTPIARKISPLRDIVTLMALVRIISARRVDILHSYTPKGGLLGQIAASLTRVPARIHACRGLLYTPGMPAWRRQLFRMTDRVTNSLATRTLFVSAADLAYSVSDGLCSARKCVHTGSGIDTKWFDAEARPMDTRDTTRIRLGIPADADMVLSVGRYVRDKGYGDIGAAIPAILARRPSAHFVWVAPIISGEEGVMSPQYLQVKGLASRVTVLPHQADMRPIYLAADMLLHASHREGVPRVLMEASAMGLPIAASDIGGCREVIRDLSMGLLFPAHDSGAIADAVVELLAHPDRATALARAAQDDVRRRYDQDALSTRIWEVYRSVLPQR